MPIKPIQWIWMPIPKRVYYSENSEGTSRGPESVLKVRWWRHTLEQSKRRRATRVNSPKGHEPNLLAWKKTWNQRRITLSSLNIWIIFMDEVVLMTLIKLTKPPLRPAYWPRRSNLDNSPEHIVLTQLKVTSFWISQSQHCPVSKRVRNRIATNSI